MSKEIKITQTRSVIRRPKKQRDTIKSLGLHGIRKSVVKQNTSAVKGMLNAVSHLVTVEDLK
jgi:large subunit ribosomal protein L30